MDGSLAELGAGPVGLDTSEAEGYITVKPRYKQQRVLSTETAPVHNNGVHPAYKVLIKPIKAGKSLNRVNAINDIYQTCGRVKTVRKIWNALTVHCHNGRQAQLLKEITKFCGIEVTVTEDFVFCTRIKSKKHKSKNLWGEQRKCFKIYFSQSYNRPYINMKLQH